MHSPTYVHTHMYNVYVCMYTCIIVVFDVCIYLHNHFIIQFSTVLQLVYVCMYACMYVCMRMYVCMYVCMYVFVCACMHVLARKFIIYRCTIFSSITCIHTRLIHTYSSHTAVVSCGVGSITKSTT